MKKVLALMALALAVAACEPVTRTMDVGYSPASGAIAAMKNNKKLLIAAEDHNQLLVVDRETKALDARIDVGAGPAHVIELANGDAAVTTRYGNALVIVDVDNAKVKQTIEVGSEPIGLVEVEPGTVAVALAGEARLAVVTLKSAEINKIDLVDADPRAVALAQNGDVYVTHLTTGKLSRVELASGIVTAVNINTRNDFGPAIETEHLRSLTVDGKTGRLFTASTAANTSTVRAPRSDIGIDDPGIGGGESNCGYSGCPAELGAVNPIVTVVDTDNDVVVVPQGNNNQGQNVNAGFEDCFDCGGGFATTSPNPPSVLNTQESRLAGVKINNPAAVALFDGGRGQAIVNLGTHNVLLLRSELKGTADDVIAEVKVGEGAQSIAISADGEFAYVWNQFDATISEIKLPQLEDRLDQQTKFVPDQKGEPTTAELGPVPQLAANTFTVVADALPADVSIGRKMFHDATDPAIAQSSAVSCASCHPDGRGDGRTWLFTFGPRNTPQLGGGILETAPFHWPGDVANVPDLNRMTVLPFMGGTGVDASRFEYVGAFIDSIKAAPSPVAALRGQLNASQLRGKQIFESAETGCTNCHAGEHHTDNVSWNIGSRSNRVGTDIDAFQTPVLHGLARSAPYFHDGKYQNLTDLVRDTVLTNKMGTGSHLSTNDVGDLVEYLKTL